MLKAHYDPSRKYNIINIKMLTQEGVYESAHTGPHEGQQILVDLEQKTHLTTN